ncbi:MAG: YihA family ribosome biogenesis GTP-binding protein [Bacteroidales bacterium]|nr:YihA family ribosome biogenesis GTP-binding protein [Candidatus Liminaster caballi]
MKSEYVISNTDWRKCPDTQLPEYAFIGRSNVGKSSLINMLTQHNGLAKTSAKPGKTLLINHFMIDDSWYIVDLPGYGYARIGKTGLEKLQRLINGYILNRPQLTCLMLLIDSRHAPQQIDLDFMQMLGENGVPFAIIFTKLDKISNREWQNNFKAYKARLEQDWEELPPIFATSAAKGTGREEILEYISQINTQMAENKKNNQQ